MNSVKSIVTALAVALVASFPSAVQSRPAAYPIIRGTPGEVWTYFADGHPGPGPSVMYGPPESDSNLVLTCQGRNLKVEMYWVEARRGQQPAILTSGGATVRARSVLAPDEEMPSLWFNVPLDNTVVDNLSRYGFVISFPNGERNPYPPGPQVSRFTRACRARAH